MAGCLFNRPSPVPETPQAVSRCTYVGLRCRLPRASTAKRLAPVAPVRRQDVRFSVSQSPTSSWASPAPSVVQTTMAAGSTAVTAS